MNRWVILVLGSCIPLAAVQADSFGRQEHARVLGGTPIEIVAKLDSGVDRSALHAVGVKYFIRESATWVRFTVDNGSVLPGSRAVLERKVLKDVRVKQKGGGVEHRPLVEMEFCIGDKTLKAQVSLSDRSSFTAPLLLGRPELVQLGSIDATREFTREPICQAPQPESRAPGPAAVSLKSTPIAPLQLSASSASAFVCDGRTRCTQMHSCEEAKFFVKNCPGTEMDGDGDGIPCEDQFCRR